MCFYFNTFCIALKKVVEASKQDFPQSPLDALYLSCINLISSSGSTLYLLSAMSMYFYLYTSKTSGEKVIRLSGFISSECRYNSPI